MESKDKIEPPYPGIRQRLGSMLSCQGCTHIREQGRATIKGGAEQLHISMDANKLRSNVFRWTHRSILVRVGKTWILLPGHPLMSLLSIEFTVERIQDFDWGGKLPHLVLNALSEDDVFMI